MERFTHNENSWARMAFGRRIPNVKRAAVYFRGNLCEFAGLPIESNAMEARRRIFQGVLLTEK
ncbi:MAG: hypothetical protein EBS01_10445 [Verrucomicrobia bacterium]|nr:hypothetical protein [Verrucomicrobiota bacterium]